jgi:hypothetical protein
MKEVLGPDRADFSIAEESRQADRAEMLLHFPGVVVRFAKQMIAAPIATA